jgi:hypothetical protein
VSADDDGPVGWIREIVLDSADPRDLARFWAGLLGGGPIVHFDVLVNDLAGAHKRIVAPGGAFLSGHVSPRPGPGGEAIPWRVYRKILPARLVTGPAAKPAASGSSPPAAQAGIHRRGAGAELD